MQVVRAKVMGFCMGVRRAVAMTNTELNRAKAAGERVCTYGPLIHNPKVVAEFKERGLTEITEISSIPAKKIDVLQPESFADSTDNFSLVIRAHGIDPQIEKEMRDKGMNIIDATCQNVKKSQLKAKALSEAGYFIFLAGDANHAEVTGIVGYAKLPEGRDNDDTCNVISCVEEAEHAAEKLFKANKEAKTALLGQTTISDEEYIAMGEAIKKYFPDIEITKTICNATIERQQALRDLLKEVDAVLIIGGSESANTRRLLSIAQESGKPCALVEKSSDIPSFFYACRKVGLSAGASTPDSTIDEVEMELLR